MVVMAAVACNEQMTVGSGLALRQTALEDPDVLFNAL